MVWCRACDRVAELPGPIEAPQGIQPQTKGFNGTVNISAVIRNPYDSMDRLNTISQLQAATLSLNSALLALAPIKARIDNGADAARRPLTGPSTTYLNVPAFPATGLINTLPRRRHPAALRGGRTAPTC